MFGALLILREIRRPIPLSERITCTNNKKESNVLILSRHLPPECALVVGAIRTRSLTYKIYPCKGLDMALKDMPQVF
jgi:hypothetical protein